MTKMGTRLRRVLTHAGAGSAMAELVVIMPLLLVILAATVRVGQLGDYAIKVGNAARAGVQYGSQNISTAVDNTGMQNAALNDAQNVAGLNASPSHFCICADGSPSQCLQGDCAASHRLVYVQVVATGKLTTLPKFPGIPASLSTVTIQRTAVMRVAE
jgi:TadE-like protein